MATVELIPNGELEFTDVKMENGRLSGKPIFYGNGKDVSSMLTLIVKSDKGETLRRYLLCLEGATAKVSVLDRSARVQPAFEQSPEPEKVEKPKSKSAPSLI